MRTGHSPRNLLLRFPSLRSNSSITRNEYHPTEIINAEFRPILYLKKEKETRATTSLHRGREKGFFPVLLEVDNSTLTQFSRNKPDNTDQFDFGIRQMPRDGVGKMLVRRFETWETRTFRDYGMKDGNYPVPCISGTVFKKKK